MHNNSKFVALAHTLADSARGILGQYYRRPLSREDKADLSPVTVADRAVEEMVRKTVSRTFPAHGVLGEEFPPLQPDAEYLWVVDPIDGTKAFICGIPVFTTLIALTRNGSPILGLIDQPVTRERWLGADGAPSTLNGAPVVTRKCSALSDAALCATQLEMFATHELPAFKAVATQTRFVRYGTDGYGYAALATGQVDIVMEADLGAHDFMALAPVIEGAGGVISDWSGNPLKLTTGRSQVLAAGDRQMHAEALDRIHEASTERPRSSRSLSENSGRNEGEAD